MKGLEKDAAPKGGSQLHGRGISSADCTPLKKAQGEPEHNIGFLNELLGDDLVWLVAMKPESGPVDHLHVPANDHARIEAFVNRHDGKNNLYWTPNKISESFKGGQKPSADDVECARMVWVDLDPPEAAKHQEWREKTLAELQEFEPTPTAIVNSGRGFQAFWALDEPKFRQQLECIAQLGQMIEARLQSDAVHNVDRVMRLPGTTNIASQNKVESGFPPKSQAEVVSLSGLRYSYDHLVKSLSNDSNVLEFPLEARPDYIKEATRGSENVRAEDLEAEHQKLTLDRAEDLLESIHPDLSHDEWVKVGTALKTEFGDEGFDLYLEWSQSATKWSRGKWNQRRLKKKWKSFREGAVSGGTLVWLARAHRTTGDSIVDELNKKIEVLTESGKLRKKSEILLDIVDQYEVFRDEQGRGYCIIPFQDHKEVWPIKSVEWRNHLRIRFRELTGRGPSDADLNEGCDTAIASALTKPSRKVYRRVAQLEDRIYVDLGTRKWEVVEVTAHGWRITTDCPVMLTRTQTTSALPIPVQGWIDDLRPFVNVTEENFPLVAGWILHAFADRGPRIHVGIVGEQGTAKSTLTRFLMQLVDPSSAPLRTPPKTEEDLLITASRNHVLALDNMSSMRFDFADALCRLATGGAMGKRELYTDADEVILDAQRNVIMNGISTDLVTRPDLAERTVVLELEPISRDKRKTEHDLWERFEAARPGIFGAVLNALSHGLANFRTVSIDDSPRMADAVRWIAACETDPDWTEASGFLEAFNRTQRDAVFTVLDTDPVARLVRLLVAQQKPDDVTGVAQWAGTASELKEKLETLHTLHSSGEYFRAPEGWPKTAAKLSARLTRVTPALRQAEIVIRREKRNHERVLVIEQTALSEHRIESPETGF